MISVLPGRVRLGSSRNFGSGRRADAAAAPSPLSSRHRRAAAVIKSGRSAEKDARMNLPLFDLFWEAHWLVKAVILG